MMRAGFDSERPPRGGNFRLMIRASLDSGPPPRGGNVRSMVREKCYGSAFFPATILAGYDAKLPPLGEYFRRVKHAFSDTRPPPRFGNHLAAIRTGRLPETIILGL